MDEQQRQHLIQIATSRASYPERLIQSAISRASHRERLIQNASHGGGGVSSCNNEDFIQIANHFDDNGKIRRPGHVPAAFEIRRSDSSTMEAQ
ncbi:hypothetical protein EYF80_048614 [Liparis tanakae]|uniref:Uncharacterized protein n=1 Tax=Liparis tanakae TaxID=230148 RepID=A0A4Z2FLS7_9TELE|nr:hypothetical protein EYF80_048614 [Liparis tanakae]